MMAEDENSRKRLIYYAARDGMAKRLYDLLFCVPDGLRSYFLDSLSEDSLSGQKCSPLIIAVVNGNNFVVQVLLRLKANIEQEGSVLIDGYLIDGATALWCAAGTGNLVAVMYLVHAGADVDHPTSTKSTPLRAACFDGRLKVVQYLVENGANLHVANQYNNTCLMIASYRGHYLIVSYLLSQDADINAQAHCGATALHFAAEHGHLAIVKLLLKAGAKILKNKIGMSALITAADRARSDVVTYLIGTNLFSENECMEALELLGASYANDKDHYSLQKAYFYLEWAMKNRCDDSHLYGPKKLLPPIRAYDYQVECQTLEELQAIRYNANALHIESLLIRERILGSDNPEVPHPIIFRGAVFADNGEFGKCVNLLLHALQIRHCSNVTVQEDLLRFAQLFSQMLHLGEEVLFCSLSDVLSVTLNELKKNSKAISEFEIVSPSFIEGLEANMLTALYLFVISTKLMAKFTDSEQYRIYELVYKIIKLPLVTRNGSTLLHLAVCTDTPVDEFHTKNVCKFPCAATTRMIIHCGADVNAVDIFGNTPLHIIVAYQKPITDFMTLHSIINQLIDAGAHLDYVNSYNETPAEAVLTGVAEIILRTQYKMSLKCIAAKAVRRFNICYDDNLPDSLKTFTDRHGVPRKKKCACD